MSSWKKTLQKLLLGPSHANIDFEAVCSLLRRLGFQERIKGSHHIFYKSGIEEILNLQPQNGKGKTYQMRQIREILIKYQMLGEIDEN